ncbi:MAG: glycoside hydrolase family 15 protein, partial [Gemmatimonadetes bacterium]|nr:glycoside hydrolase family 15 protein [Gemmatimonadota bacterium]
MVPIQDYALIGNCRSAALISRSGSIDWLCWPRFDSPSLFAALLDERAGRWSITPTGPYRAERRYEPGTNVLRTTFHTTGGTAVLTDLMPVASEEEKHHRLFPDHEILRVLECTQGEADLEMRLEPRPGYGRQPFRIRDAGNLGLRIESGPVLLGFRSTVPLELDDAGARAHLRLRAGQSVTASLTYADDLPAVFPPLGQHARDVLRRSIEWWQGWIAQISYHGPWQEAVARSALALKLLEYAPSGAMVAAPTTSLPERIGGDLNWDYRYCWLRDASLTVRALFGLGFVAEAKAFLSWLLHSTSLTSPKLRTFYDVFGKHPPAEQTLDHFSGYRGSRPVRVGNAAADQHQLDVYGEVIDAVTLFVQRGGKLDRETRHMLDVFGRYVSRHWSDPDEGIWEPRRSGRRQNTHSAVLCWAALDRLIGLAEVGVLKSKFLEEFRAARSEIRRAVEERAWNGNLGAYTGRLGEDDLDAAVILLPWYGFTRASSERMRMTYQRIRKQLGAGHGLLYRYRRVDSPGEGAFGIGGCGGGEALARGGGPSDDAPAEGEPHRRD